jgi:SAM-dependent methyltransferase
LSGGLSYFDYQRAVAETALIPWLEQRIELEGLRVADFGAHQGGGLEALRADGRVAGGLGFELEPRVVATSPFVADRSFRLECRDVLTLDTAADAFDLIVLTEVLEHVPDTSGLLAVGRSALGVGGHILVTFPPYWSPYGGHQQLAGNWTRIVPYFHLLPERTMLRLARVQDNVYMSREDALADIKSVRRTRLTLAGAERAFSGAGFEVVDRTIWALRPEFRIRYGVPQLEAGVMSRVPLAREALVTGAYYLLRKP